MAGRFKVGQWVRVMGDGDVVVRIMDVRASWVHLNNGRNENLDNLLRVSDAELRRISKDARELADGIDEYLNTKKK